MGILNVPGLAKTSAAFVRSLLNMAERNGWSPTGIAAVIASESGFNPSAKNPGSSATGLLQFTEGTAKSLGTTTAAIRNMGAIDQLALVEKFFRANMPRVPSDPRDYKLVVFGRGDLVGSPDDTVVYAGNDENPRMRAAYEANRSLDTGSKGYISSLDLRQIMNRYVAPSLGELDMTKLAVAAGGAELLLWMGLGFLAWRKAKAKR